LLQLIAKGKTNKEVATKLNLSVYTVDSHRGKIMEKLNHYRLKAVGCLTTESRGTRLKPSEVLPAQSRLQGLAGAVILKP
jgi:hypothetical protein